MVRWIGSVGVLGALASFGCGDDGEVGDPTAGGTEASSTTASSAGSETQGSAGSETTEGGTDSGSETQTTSASTTAGSDSDSEGTTGGPSDAERVELRVGDFEVPTNQTYYACFEFTFSLDTLAHIVGFTPQIDNGAHVHHFVLTQLDGPSGSPDGYSCYDTAGEIIWAWAPGVTEYFLPEEAGFLIGNATDGRVTLRLQVHYNNPQNVSGARDDSGLDLWVTDQLRPNRAGTLVVADVVGFTIPPEDPAYEHVTTCRSQVTQSVFPGPLNVFGTSLHAHEIGSVLYTEVWRDGALAFELNRDDPYSFENQHMKFVDYVLQPGDEIRNHCIYDSTERTGITTAGPSTDEEMCWNAMIYYPRIPSGFDFCSSAN
jgi:hypothetical protein